MSIHRSANPLDRPRVVAGAIAVFSAGILLFNILPLLLGVTADALALTPQQLGLLGSAYLAAFALATVPCVALLPRLSWRVVGLGAGLIAVTALLTAAQSDRYSELLFLFVVVGVAQSLLVALGNRVLGATSDPDRSYGFGYWVGLCIAAGLIFLFAHVVVPTWGYVGVYRTTAAVIAVLVAGCLQLPRNAAVALPDTPLERGRLTPAIALGLMAMAIYFVGLAGLWAFVERIGISRGIARDTVGAIVAISLIVSAFGSLAPILTEGRYSRGMMLLTTSAATLAAMVLLALSGSTRGFVAGAMLFNFVWGSATVYIAAIIALADSSGRFLPLIGGAMSVGATFGPVLTGTLIRGSDFSAVFALCGAAATLSAILAIASERRATVAR